MSTDNLSLSSTARGWSNVGKVAAITGQTSHQVAPEITRPKPALLAARKVSDAFGLPARSSPMRRASTVSQDLPSSTSTSFIDLFVGKGSGDQRRRSLDQALSTPVVSTSVLDGPSSWFGNLFAKNAKDEPTTKDSGDQLLADEDRSAEDEPVWSRVKERYETPRLPIVFCHGLFGFDKIGIEALPFTEISYWRGIREALEAAGCEVLITRVPMSASIEERARVLSESIGQKLHGREVNLVGHSMGGLDARFLVSRLKPINFKVKTITSISTPHLGSTFADYVLDEIVGKNNVPLMLSTLNFFQVPGGGKAFEDLTTTSMAKFNKDVPDDPNVAYYSYGARCEPGLLDPFRFSWNVVKDLEGDNDGLVSLSSAKYGQYLGTLENVNHADQCGWLGPVRYRYADFVGKPIKYRPASFYLSIAEHLAKEGF